MLKIIQWCTGVTAQHVARAIMAHPDMELVGAYVTSEAKDGRDIGEICGVDPIGVKATTEKEVIYAMEADCVMYMSLGEGRHEQAVAEISRLLASGKNVVSTATTSLIYPKTHGPELVAQLEEACRAGGTTFHATGIEPGWAGELLPLTLSAITGRVDFIYAQEVLDYSGYDAPVAMFDMMGFGGEAHDVPPMQMSPEQAPAFGAPMLMMADALGATIDHLIYQQDVVLAPEDLQIAAGTIRKGTLAGKRYSFTAVIDGEPRIKIEHVTRCGAPVPADWSEGQGWYVTLTGAPNLKLSVEIGLNGQHPNDAACLATGMHAVHAVPLVVAAEPGIRTLIDLPMIMGRGIIGKGFAAMPS